MHELAKRYHTRDIVKDIDKKIRKTRYDPWYQRSRWAVAINDELGNRLPMSFRSSYDFESSSAEEPPPFEFKENEYRISSASESSSSSEEIREPTVESHVQTQTTSGIETPASKEQTAEQMVLDRAAEHKLRIEKARQEEIDKLAKEKQEKEEELEKERQSKRESEQFRRAYDEYKSGLWDGHYEVGTKEYPMKGEYHLVKLDNGDRHNLRTYQKDIASKVRESIKGLKSYPSQSEAPRKDELYYNKEGNYIIFKPQYVTETTKDKYGKTLREHLETAVKARYDVDSEKKHSGQNTAGESLSPEIDEAVEAVKQDIGKWEKMSSVDAMQVKFDLQNKVSEDKPKDVNYYSKILGLHVYNSENPFVAIDESGKTRVLIGQGRNLSDESLMNEVKNRYVKELSPDVYKKFISSAGLITEKKFDKNNKWDNIRLFDLMGEGKMKEVVSAQMINYPQFEAIFADAKKKLDEGEEVKIEGPYPNRDPIAVIQKIRSPKQEYNMMFSNFLSRAEFNGLINKVKKSSAAKAKK